MDNESKDIPKDDLWGKNLKDELFINATYLYQVNMPILYPYPPSIWN